MPVDKPIKIGYDAKRAFFNKTGLGNYSRTFLTKIIESKKNDDVFLFTPKVPKDFYGLNNKNVHIISPKGSLNKALKSLWRSVWLGSILKNYNLDLYHGLSQELPLDIAKAKCKTVVTIHDLIFLRYKQGYNRINTFTYKRKAKFACDNANHIIAISEQTKQDIIHFFNISPEKITVIYQDCSAYFKIPSTSQEKNEVRRIYDLPERFILSVGVSNLRKNNKTLIEAISKVNKDIPLVIAGNGAEKEELIKFVKQKKLESKVRFLGFVPNEHLKALYSLAEIYVYPSLFEGFGIPILEALYSSTPVITGVNGCFAEVGGKHAIYVDQTNSNEMAKAIEELYQNQPKQKALMKDVEHHLMKFSSENTFPQVEEVYQKLLYSKKRKSSSVSALLICYNEENNIRDYLDNMSFADEIIVVDSYSLDKTAQIIKSEYPHVLFYQREFDNFTAQRNYAISLASKEWITFFDADERIDKSLKKEILDTISNPQAKDAYYISRNNFYLQNKRIRFSGWKNDKVIRLFKNHVIKYDERYLVHEQITATNSIGTLNTPLQHYSVVNIEDYKQKLDHYAQLRAKELYLRRAKASTFKKEFKSKFRFIKHYIIQFGFLDGKEGFLIAKLYEDYVRKRFEYLEKLYAKEKHQ